MTWQIDRDCTLMAVQTNGGNHVVSYDPALTTTSFAATPSSDTVRHDIVAHLNSGSAAGASCYVQLNTPLVGGRNLFIAFGQAAQLLMYLEDPIANQ